MFGSDMRERTDHLHGELQALCAALDPNTVPLTDTPEVFDSLVAIQKLAEGAVVRMAARYEEAGQWRRNGARSFEDDLADKTGSSKGQARNTAKTSRRLRKQPKTDDAVRDGKLSPEQADAVASGAEASPDDVDALLESAGRRPLHELKEEAARARARGDNDRDATRRRQHKLRCYRQWTDEEGMSNHLLRLPPEKGAEVNAKLATDVDRAFSDARAAGRLEPREAYAADVVFDLLTGRRTSRYTEPRPASTAGVTPRPGGDPSGTGQSGPSRPDSRATGASARARPPGDDRSPRRLSGPVDPGRPVQTDKPAGSNLSCGSHEPSRSNPPDSTRRDGSDALNELDGLDRPDGSGGLDSLNGRLGPQDIDDGCGYQPRQSGNRAVRPERKVIVHVDVAALNRGRSEGDELCEIAGVGPVSVPVVRSMLADAFVAIVIKDGADIKHVTHLGRQVTARQRTALEARGYRCEIEGCGSTYRLDIDHNMGFTLTHDTRIDDLSWLCGHHHDHKTCDDLILVGPTGHKHLVPRRSDGTPAKPTPECGTAAE